MSRALRLGLPRQNLPLGETKFCYHILEARRTEKKKKGLMQIFKTGVHSDQGCIRNEPNLPEDKISLFLTLALSKDKKITLQD